MGGNVREWVADWFDYKYYLSSPYENPKGAEIGTERSLRGGAYDANTTDITTFRRYKHEPDLPGAESGASVVRKALIIYCRPNNTW